MNQPSADAKNQAATEMNGHVDPGVSLRFGPVEKEDVDMPDAEAEANGTGASKRKARESAGQRKSYAEPESSEEEEDKPLVRSALQRQLCLRFPIATLFAVAVLFNS